MFPRERELGVYDVDAATPASITAHAPGYIDRPNEIIVGLQTDAPLKRAIMPFGGWRMVATSLETYGYPVSPELETIFTKYRKTHNDGVFDVYPPAVKRARHSHLITGLPDAYGRGRIIGDYRRVALYGVTALIAAKKLERGLRQEDRQHPRRSPGRCAIRPRSQPDERPRHPRHACLGTERGETALL